MHIPDNIRKQIPADKPPDNNREQLARALQFYTTDFTKIKRKEVKKSCSQK